VSAGLRVAPWVRRQVLTVNDRAEIHALPDDLVVTIWPTPVWSSRTWNCRIARGDLVLAKVEGHAKAMDAFRAAVELLPKVPA
jgi:hypothetical protein